MTSSLWRPSSRDELSGGSVQTAEDSASEGYALTRQPARTDPRNYYNLASLSSESQESKNTPETTPEAPASPEMHTVNQKTITMEIPLEDVDLVQIFLRANGSVKGICFNYHLGDMEELGCCEAEPGCWYACVRPQWLLFEPARGHAVGRGFFPVRNIWFEEACHYSKIKMMFVKLSGSLMFRLSPDGLEIDVGRHKVWSGKKTFKQAMRDVKECLECNCLLSGLSTTVREIGNTARRFTKKIRQEI